MSTILDALKRVQRDREQARPLDLRESVTAAEFPLRRKRRERSWRLPVLLVVFAAGAAALGYERGQALLAPEDDNLLELALAAPPPEPGLGTPPPAPEPTAPAPLVPEPSVPETLEPEPALVPEAPPEYPVAQGAPARAPRVPRSLPGPADAPDAAQGGVAAEAPAPVAAAVPPQPVEPQPVQVEPPTTAARDPNEPVGRPATRTYPSLPRRLPARSRDVARTERPRAAPTPSASPTPSAPPAIQRADADDFPEIRVANVVWHPEPSRRRAEVTIEQTRLADAREGDIVKGVEVEKIEPGAVEFKLGSALKTVRIGP